MDTPPPAGPQTQPTAGDRSSSGVRFFALRVLRSPAVRTLFVVAMVAGVGFIALASADYLSEGALHPFVREKRALGRTAWWQASLAVHVVAALVAFPSCLLLSSRWFLRATPRGHRLLGRVVGVVVLFLLLPSGFVLSLSARGGFWGGAGFVVSGAITGTAMVLAIASARRRDVLAHRRAVAHVIAQMSVAVVSRVLLVVAAFVAPTVAPTVDPDVVYVVALWVPVLAGAVVAHVVVPARPAEATPPVATPVFAPAGVPHEAARLAHVHGLRPVG